VAWSWDFDNDGVADSTEQNPTYEYAEDGVYTVNLKVRESDGDSETKTKVEYITVIKVNAPPVSNPAGPYTGTEGVAIAYDGSGSYDTDGNIVAYDWDFGDGNTATGAAPTHTYAQRWSDQREHNNGNYRRYRTYRGVLGFAHQRTRAINSNIHR
jgi:PKD repeat protein